MIKNYFAELSGSGNGRYHQIILLHESPDMSWDSIKQKVPNLSKAWFELAQLSSQDRVEFTRDFWLSKLPYCPEWPACLARFFNSVEEIGVVLSQKRGNDPFEAHLIYALKQGRGFFHGAPGAGGKELASLQELFPRVILPEDYLAFLEIHNGFCKSTDTGVMGTHQIPEMLSRFRGLFNEQNLPMTAKGDAIDPSRLIPFYESFGMPFYQCFYQDWYPENEMGNVYFSGSTYKISSKEIDEMSFATFLDWLIFYLEQVE